MIYKLVMVGFLSVILLTKLGLGITLGDPTGINLKSWFKPPNQAIEVGLSWSIVRDHIFVFGDWNKTFHRIELKDLDTGFYSGLGVFLGVFKLGILKDTILGLKIPLGVDLFLKIPINLSLEISPALSLVPSTDLSLFGFIAIRYIFDSSR